MKSLEKKVRQLNTAARICRVVAIAGFISIPASVAVQKFSEEPITQAFALKHEITYCHKYAETPERCSAIEDEYNRLTASEEYSDAKVMRDASDYVMLAGGALFIGGLFGFAIARRKGDDYQEALYKENQ